jgi:hypothetical protein
MRDSVVTVAVNTGDPDPGTVEEFREETELALVMVWLSETEAELLEEEWGIPDLLPVTVFFAPDGEEYLRVSGSRDAEFFREAVVSGFADRAQGNGEEQESLHINVVGESGDPVLQDLLEYSLELAGHGAVDFFDPSVPEDLDRIRALYLPETGYPYAQPCIGSACGRPASTREELLSAVEMLRP